MAQSILIVDDEKEIVSMLYCYFSKLGYTVYTATAGNAALKEVEKKPDIILLDVNMPDIDGFTVCERIRTPLTLLKGHATMLLSFIPKGLVSQEEILDEISVMSKNVSRLEKYVNAMTNLYRLEDIDIPRQQITFHALIDNFNNTAEALCYDKHFSITTSGDNITLFINLNTVMQIYENLLSNSIRYAKSDIDISVVIENNNLVISVSDDGCGFKNIDIEKATLPFYKSSKDISTEHLGLGLNISKILSERHGGNIQIANNEAGGACVTVKINCNES